MPRLLRQVSCLLFVLAVSNLAAQGTDSGPVKVASPDGQVVLTLSDGHGVPSGQVSSAGAPVSGLRYSITFHGKPLLNDSALGIKIEGQPALGPAMHIATVKTGSVNQSYTIPVGKTSNVRDHYNSARANCEDDAGHKLWLDIRAYDDGVAFRYFIPEQPGFDKVRIEHELTGFQYSNDATLYPLVVDGFQSAYEDDYQMRTVSSIHKDWLIALPLLAEVPAVGWMAVTEADIDDYAGMYLRKDNAPLGLRAELSPSLTKPNIAVESDLPVTTPWRVLMIGDAPGRLIESNIVLNLNPPTKMDDTSWIKAGKSAWDWWSGPAAPSAKFKPGMNTATMKQYIDFASASGFTYMLIDAGWAVAERKGPQDYSALADITRVTPEIDMPELLRYAKQKNIRIWLWSHWTSVDKYMDQAFPQFEQWGIAGVKIDFMNRDDQQMVAWYHHVVELAAKHHLMIDYHGAYKPDGLRRTFPNLITRESVMGKEYSKWSARTTPVHNTTLPFTRMLAGPLDYTPGGFGNSNRENFVAHNLEPMVLGTRAHELALYVVLESPLMMVSDYPEHYAGQHDFEFIKQVPTTWDEVRVIGGRPMENITLARRSSKDWYIGSLTNWSARNVKVPLDFLGEGKYVAEIYADAPDAATVATHTSFTTQPVDRSTVLDVQMVSGGGNAIWIHPVS